MKGWQWLIVIGFIALAAGGGYVATSNTSSDLVQRIAMAIATAEGFFVAGSVPQRQNNPGDLKLSGDTITSFPTVEAGWAALYHQVNLMLYGGSAHYDPSMSISQIAQIYTDPVGAPGWAANVANYLGVTTDTTLNQLLGVA